MIVPKFRTDAPEMTLDRIEGSQVMRRVDGKLDEVPKGADERKAWLKQNWIHEPKPDVRASLVKWYGAEKGNSTKYYEAFEICEYGAQPSEARIRQLFPMLH